MISIKNFSIALTVALGALMNYPVPSYGRECDRHSLNEFPEFLTPGRGVVKVDHPFKGMATGFVVGNPFAFADQCGQSAMVTVNIITASHLLNIDSLSIITPLEVAAFEEYSSFTFNYLEGLKPFTAYKCKVIWHPQFTDCFNPLFDGIPSSEDFIIAAVTIAKSDLDRAMPWYFGLDFSENLLAQYVNITHPDGDLKKLNLVSEIKKMPEDFCYRWSVRFKLGTGEGGVSGSPVLDAKTWRVAGLDVEALGKCPSFCYAVNLGFARNKGFLDSLYKETKLQSLTKIDGYPHAQAVMGGLYSGRDTTIASGTEVQINRLEALGIVVQDHSKIFLGAPLLDMSGSLSPWGYMRIFSHSHVGISTGELNMPRLMVAPNYPPGSEGWDGSSINIKACKSQPIEKWEFGQDAVANVEVKNAELRFGLPVGQATQPALSFSPTTRLTFQAQDIVINQSIEATAFLVPWDETGFLKFITPNNIIINPMDLPELSFDLATQAIMASNTIMIQNANMIMAGTSWRVSGQNISAENMHLYRDVVADYRPDDDVYWITNKMNVRNFTLRDAQLGQLSFTGTDMMLDNFQINSASPRLNLTLNASRMTWQNFYLTSELGLNFTVPAAQLEGGYLNVCTLVPQQMQKSVTPALAASAAPLSITLQAAKIDGDFILDAYNNSVSIKTGTWTQTPKSELISGKAGRITLTAMSKTETASYLSTLNNDLNEEIAAARTLPNLESSSMNGDGAAFSLAATLDAGMTAVEENSVSNPSAFAMRAYPNPFNAQTTIHLETPDECDLKVSIYNVRGQLVKNLFDGRLNPGSHKMQWNSALSPSGMYLCIMKGKNIQNGAAILKKLKLTSIK